MMHDSSRLCHLTMDYMLVHNLYLSQAYSLSRPNRTASTSDEIMVFQRSQDFYYPYSFDDKSKLGRVSSSTRATAKTGITIFS